MSSSGIQFETDGRTVWINNSFDYCIGRFGVMGIDVHRPPTEFSLGECAHCTHGPVTSEDWETFKEKMKEIHNVIVGDDMKPERFK